MATGLYHKLKMLGYEVELVTEFAKDLTWQESFKMLGDQFIVSATQAWREASLYGKVDIIITDSPTLIGMVYYQESDPVIKDLFVRYMVECFKKKKDNINFFVNRGPYYNPKGRNQSLKEAQDIDSEIREILESNDIEYENVEGTEDGQDYVFKRVYDQLHERFIRWGK